MTKVPTGTSNPESRMGQAMPDVTSEPILPPAEPPHAVEVRDAQATLDASCTVVRETPLPGGNLVADRELLRALVAAYGADGVRKIIDSLT